MPKLIAILTGVVFILFAAWQFLPLSRSEKSVKSATTSTTPSLSEQIDRPEISSEGNPVIGSAQAPLTLYYWFDYQCPFCKQFDEETLSVLMDKYVSTEKLRIVFKNNQSIGPDSQSAGIIGSAVWEAARGSYLKWHQAVFQKQDIENGGWGSQADLLELTKTIPEINFGDIIQLSLKNETSYRRKLDVDREEGRKLKIRTTPSVIIGDQLIRGAQPTSVYLQVIDALLAK